MIRNYIIGEKEEEAARTSKTRWRLANELRQTKASHLVGSCDIFQHEEEGGEAGVKHVNNPTNPISTSPDSTHTADPIHHKQNQQLGSY